MGERVWVGEGAWVGDGAGRDARGQPSIRSPRMIKTPNPVNVLLFNHTGEPPFHDSRLVGFGYPETSLFLDTESVV